MQCSYSCVKKKTKKNVTIYLSVCMCISQLLWVIFLWNLVEVFEVNSVSDWFYEKKILKTGLVMTSFLFFSVTSLCIGLSAAWISFYVKIGVWFYHILSDSIMGYFTSGLSFIAQIITQAILLSMNWFVLSSSCHFLLKCSSCHLLIAKCFPLFLFR